MDFEQELHRCLEAHEDSIIDPERIELLIDDIMPIYYKHRNQLINSHGMIALSKKRVFDNV